MRLFAIVAAMVALAHPAWSQDKADLDRDIEKSIERLYSEKGNESDIGRQELTQIGRRAAARVAKELAGKGGGDRKSNARVRRLLCEILGDIRDGSSAVVDVLIDRLGDTEEHGLSVGAAAAYALGQIADERAIPALVKTLNSKAAESDRWLKRSCIVALGILRARDAVPALIKATEDKSSADIGGYDKRHLIRADAADALGLIGAKDAVESLGKLLNVTDVNPGSTLQVSIHAARALERILGTSRGALSGSTEDVNNAVTAWKKWWTTEETKKNVAKARTQLAEMSAALEKFKGQFGKYPEILDYIKTKPAGDDYKNYPDGGFYSGDLNDPWGKKIVYDSKGENGAPFDLVSYGRDGMAWGGGDDADVWNHENYGAVRLQKSRDALKAVQDAIQKYQADYGKPPATLSDLTKAPTDGKNGGKAYLDKIPRDGFENILQYTPPPNSTKDAPYDLKSYGSDRKEGGAGLARDLWNHDLWIQGRIDRTKELLKTIADAVERFRKEQERLPEELENLRVKPAQLKGIWPTSGYTNAQLTDPFGNALVYVPDADGKNFTLKSLGADGAEGGTGVDADINK